MLQRAGDRFGSSRAVRQNRRRAHWGKRRCNASHSHSLPTWPWFPSARVQQPIRRYIPRRLMRARKTHRRCRRAFVNIAASKPSGVVIIARRNADPVISSTIARNGRLAAVTLGRAIATGRSRCTALPEMCPTRCPPCWRNGNRKADPERPAEMNRNHWSEPMIMLRPSVGLSIPTSGR